MLNIFRIFISDFKRIKTNVVAVVIVIGLSIRYNAKLLIAATAKSKDGHNDHTDCQNFFHVSDPSYSTIFCTSFSTSSVMSSADILARGFRKTRVYFLVRLIFLMALRISLSISSRSFCVSAS